MPCHQKHAQIMYSGFYNPNIYILPPSQAPVVFSSAATQPVSPTLSSLSALVSLSHPKSGYCQITESQVYKSLSSSSINPLESRLWSGQGMGILVSSLRVRVRASLSPRFAYHQIGQDPELHFRSACEFCTGMCWNAHALLEIF